MLCSRVSDSYEDVESVSSLLPGWRAMLWRQHEPLTYVRLALSLPAESNVLSFDPVEKMYSYSELLMVPNSLDN